MHKFGIIKEIILNEKERVLVDTNNIFWKDLYTAYPFPYYIAVDKEKRIIGMYDNPKEMTLSGFTVYGIESNQGYSYNYGGTIYSNKAWDEETSTIIDYKVPYPPEQEPNVDTYDFMHKDMYDPNKVEKDVFSTDNHTKGEVNTVFSIKDKIKLDGLPLKGDGGNQGDKREQGIYLFIDKDNLLNVCFPSTTSSGTYKLILSDTTLNTLEEINVTSLIYSKSLVNDSLYDLKVIRLEDSSIVYEKTFSIWNNGLYELAKTKDNFDGSKKDFVLKLLRTDKLNDFSIPFTLESTSKYYKNITFSGSYSGATFSGPYSGINMTGYGSKLDIVGDSGYIRLMGRYANIYTLGQYSNIHTEGSTSSIYTIGQNSPMYTTGTNSHIFVSGQYSTIYTGGRLADNLYITPTTTPSFSNANNIIAGILKSGIGSLGVSPAALAEKTHKNSGRFIGDGEYIKGRDIGQISLYYFNASQYGLLALDGSEKKRSDYPDLWDFIKDSDKCVADVDWTPESQDFSSGDFSTTFRLPLMTNKTATGKVLYYKIRAL